ncbi:hypothetical protein MD484_g3849, partial [Candolleomyces efflorescens]
MRKKMFTGRPLVLVSHLEVYPTSSSHLLLLNQAAHQWLLPLVYHSLLFTSSHKLVKFHAAHDVPEERMRERLKLVRNLWIGAVSSNPKRRLDGDLTYPRPLPVTVITRLVLMCESLERLTLLNVDQNDWGEVEAAIPANLRSLSMGPIHGPFRIAKGSQLQQFTSINSFMRDDEVRGLVMHQTMNSFRRLSEAIDSDTLAKYAAEQVECVSDSATLKEYNIAICLRPGSLFDAHPLIDQVENELRKASLDSRAFVSTIPDRYWSDVVHDEYLSVRLAMFGALCILSSWKFKLILPQILKLEIHETRSLGIWQDGRDGQSSSGHSGQKPV